MWIKSNQHFSQLLLLFSSGWHSRIQPGHHEIWKGLLFTRDYQYERAGTAKKFHSCLENKLRLSVPAQHLEKILPSEKGLGAFVSWRIFFLSFCFGSLVGARHASLHVYLHGSVSLLCQAKKTPRFCCCCPFDFFDSLGSMPWHATVIVPLSSRGLPPGMASITRPPNNIQNAQGLGRSTLASSGIYLHLGSDSWNYWKISQTSSKTPHSSTINDHQSKSISSTYDTTSDMMQNHRLLWYCCASTNSSWTSKIFSANLSFTCSFSLTFQVSAHLQCLIQCLHCPSKELCVDVLAWMNLWMNQELTSADGFPKWWHSIIGWCRKDASRESLLTPPRELE